MDARIAWTYHSHCCKCMRATMSLHMQFMHGHDMIDTPAALPGMPASAVAKVLQSVLTVSTSLLHQQRCCASTQTPHAM